jgi:hypothetical protein
VRALWPRRGRDQPAAGRGRQVGGGPLAGRERLERTDFLGTVTRFGEHADLLAVFEATAGGDYRSLGGLDADFAAFYCRACGRPYCEACWGGQRMTFDEGFYDCTYAVCPDGHEQIIDD